MIWALVGVVLAQTPETLEGLLDRGEVNLLETWPDGSLRQVTTISTVRAPIATVWGLLRDFEQYETWMPQVMAATVVEQDASSCLVDWRIGVVGPDVSFRVRYAIDPAHYDIRGTWVSGALEHSTWAWHLEAVDGGTRVFRTVRTFPIDTNWLLKQVEDQNHTLDFGINSAVGIVEVRGIKKKLKV